ncbi:hypothetical protein FRC07_001789, partial [Ceratobasidium sp. 392]
MIKRIKRRVNRAKEKLHSLIEGPENTTPATQARAASNTEPSHADPIASQLSHATVVPRTEPSHHSPHLDPAPIVSTPADQAQPHPPPNVETSQLDNPSVQVPKRSVISMPGSENTNAFGSLPTASEPGRSKRALKGAAWSGLNTLIDVLNESTDAFGPLKSAFGGLSRCIEIYESRVEARKEYVQLQTDLNNLCRAISESLSGTTPPSMTPCVNILVRGIEAEVNLVIQKLGRDVGSSYVEAMEDSETILGCYRRIQALLNQLSVNADMTVWKIVDEEAT